MGQIKLFKRAGLGSCYNNSMTQNSTCQCPELVQRNAGSDDKYTLFEIAQKTPLGMVKPLTALSRLEHATDTRTLEQPPHTPAASSHSAACLSKTLSLPICLPWPQATLMCADIQVNMQTCVNLLKVLGQLHSSLWKDHKGAWIGRLEDSSSQKQASQGYSGS